MEDKISSYELAKRTYDVDTETSFGDKLFSAAESKAQQMYEGIKGLQLGYAQARLNALESTPDLVKDAEGNLKVGDIATKTVLRNQILEINKDIFESRMKTYTVAPEVMETSSYKLIDTGVQYGTNLAMSLIPVVGNVLTSAEMGAEILGGSFVEKLDKYKKDNPDDKMLEGFKIDNKDFAIATAKTAVNLYLEHKLGLFSQKKDVAKMFREGNLKTGALRMAGRAYAKGALKEFTTEGTQGTTDTVFDQWMGVVNESEVKDRIVQSWKDAVYAGFWGGLLEGGGAVAARGKAIQETKKAFLPNVESEEKAEVIATTIVDNLIEDTNAQIAVAAEMSSQLKARQGNLYNSLYRAVYRAVTDAKAQGAYSELSDDEIADYVASETAQQADIAMNEALKRKVPIQEVLDPNKIRYENGKIVLSENVSEEQTLNQEVIKVAQRINEIDAEERARGIPEYTAPTINVNGVERQTTNSIGNPIARSQRSLEYFYNWFGDSKAVDEQGRPIALYRGDQADIEVFDTDMQRGGNLGKAFYFTTDKEYARMYSGYDATGREPNEYYLKIENPLHVGKEGYVRAILSRFPEAGSLNTQNAIKDFLVSNGVDGVVWDRGNKIEYAVYTPNQIKSIFNEGGFTDSDNVYLQEENVEEALNEGSNNIEFNMTSLKDQNSIDYLKSVALAKGMTEKEFDALMDKVFFVADSVNDALKDNPDWRNWNAKQIKTFADSEGIPMPIRSIFVKNGDYDFNIDLGTLCVKREFADKVISYLIEKGYGDQIGLVKLEQIKSLLRKYEIAVACDVCFIEGKRLNARTLSNGLAYEWESVRQALGLEDQLSVGSERSFTPEQETMLDMMTDRRYIRPDGTIITEKEYEAMSKDEKQELQKNGMMVFQKAYADFMPMERRRVKIGNTVYDRGITPDKMYSIAKLFKQNSSLAGVLDPDMLMNSEQTTALVEKYFDTELPSFIASYAGAGTPKPLLGFNPYYELSWRDKYDRSADRLNQMLFEIGGVRGQSFSDYNEMLMIDYMQKYLAETVRGLPAHEYTKQSTLVKTFGDTGVMFNMSLVPQIEEGIDPAHYGLRKATEEEIKAGKSTEGFPIKLDNQGAWTYSMHADSFPVDEAYELRNKFDKTSGIIVVGVSDMQIGMMLDDPEIDMIIPFHASGMPAHTKLMTGLVNVDYSNVQTTKGLKKGDKDFSYNTELQKIGDPRKTAQAYLDWCAENGYTPKFPQFAKHENYYKLLEDFRGYDKNGKPILQKAVDISKADWNRMISEGVSGVKERIATVKTGEDTLVSDQFTKELEDIFKYQQVDTDTQELFKKRLKSVLGKNNAVFLKQKELLAQLRDIQGAETFRKNQDGTIYGFAHNGKVYINESVFNAHTPAHEFAHIWAKVVESSNPELWKKGVELLKQTNMWYDVRKDEMYWQIQGDENAVAREVLARLTGVESESMVRQMLDYHTKGHANQKNLIERIMNFFEQMWGTVKNAFGMSADEDITLDDFVRMPLRDLLDPKRHRAFKTAMKSANLDGQSEFNRDTVYNAKGLRGISRGSITFGQNKTWIKLTKNADATTLRHEFAHYWLDSVSKYALSGYASDEYVANWNKMAKYLNWHENMSRKEMQVAQEKFARSYEQYIKGGRYNEDLAKMYEKYDRFLQRVYANVTPQYKEKGKMVTPKLSQDAIEFFHSMTSQLPQVETGSIDATKEQTDEVVMSKTFEPVQSAGVRQQSSVFKKHTAITGDSEILEYSRADLEEQNAKAEQILDTNPELAMQIMNVSGDNEVLTNAVFNAYIRRMREQGDNEAYLEALKKQSLFLTRLGQEISSQRGAVEAIFNPVYWINKVMRNQQDELGVKGLDDLIKAKLAEGKTATQAAKEISAEQGLKLFQDNNAENTVEGVKTQLGIGVSDEQAQKIVDMTEALQKSAQNSDATGNPSVQFFKNRRSLDDYINLIAPSSNLKVFTGVVARGSLLLSVKSTTTNIIGNAVKGVLSAARRRLTNLWDKKGVNDIVSNDLKADYFNYANEVFDVSGMTISSMDELRSNEIWSEKFVSAEGEGIIQSWGRFMEKYAFKYLLGKPDLIAKNIAFVDTVAMEASNIALAEGKGQERADEIFSDAILIEPKTKIGKKVRLKGIEEALIATFQQSTKLSEFALKMREVINEKTGGMGDILIPFVKTPANIISLGIDASYGGAIAGIDILARGIKSGKFTITEGNKKKITRNALGLVTAALIAAMTDEDDYIPAYELCTPAEREFVKNTGGVFNAIRVGGVWISLDYLAGIGMPIVGFLQARREENALDKAWGYIQGTGKQALNTPVIAELKEYLVSVSKNLEGGVDKAGKNVLRETIDMLSSRVIPAFVGDIAKIVDPMERDASGSLIDPVLSKLPVIRGMLPEKQSILTGGSIEGQNPLLELFAGARVRVGAENELINNIQKVLNSGLKVSLSDPMKYGKLKSLSKEDKVKARADFAEEFFKEASKARFIDPEEYADELNKIRQKIVNRLKRKYLD